MSKLNIVPVNARGLNTKEKRIKFYSWLKDSKIDIAFLQETHYIKKNENLYNCFWFGKSIHCFSDSSHSRGVSVLLKDGLDIEILDVHISNDGRKLLFNAKCHSTEITFVNIYAPNNETYRIQFFKRIKSFINYYSNNTPNIILSGDFNCKLDNLTDKSSKILKSIISQLGLVDLWKNKHDNA